MFKFKPAVIVSLSTLLIYLLTHNPITAPYRLQLAILVILGFLGFYYWQKKSDQGKNNLFYYGITILILSIVAATGWFFSPFFFSLYLLSIFLAFVFDRMVSIIFVIILVALFSLNIGEIDVTYDFLTVLSLLTTIPLASFLRQEYLKLKEGNKDILILEKEKKEYKNKVEEILANAITNFSVEIRQNLNDAKQLAHRIDQKEPEKKFDLHRERIISSVDQGLNMLAGFEEKVTGRKLIK